MSKSKVACSVSTNQQIVYVAGPYRSDSEWGVYQNIRAAEAVAIELWKRGFAVICPHKNTAFFGGIAPDEVWLEGDKTILRRCDAVFRVSGWEKSSGAIGEIELAEELKIPIFDSLDEIERWQKIKN